MSSGGDADLVRRGYEAFQHGDLETLRQLFADDIVWHSPGRNHLAGDFSGADAVLETFGRLVQESGGTFEVEVLDLLESEQHVVVLGRASASRAGKTLTREPYCHVFRFRDGKIAESWVIQYDQAANDEFWG